MADRRAAFAARVDRGRAGVAKLKRKERHVILQCSACKDRNYVTPFKMRGGSKLAVKKYCPRCRKHTPHKSRRVD